MEDMFYNLRALINKFLAVNAAYLYVHQHDSNQKGYDIYLCQLGNKIKTMTRRVQWQTRRRR